MGLRTSDLVKLGERLRQLIKDQTDQSSMTRVVGIGADGTATTYIDKICDDAVLDFVSENDLPFNVISEESGLTSRGFERNLLVDPLDGTFNAEVGFPFYSLSVADVGTDLRSVRYGFVMNLNSGEFYYAESGKGAYRNGARIRVSESTVGCSIGNLGKYPDRSMNPLIRSPGRIRSIGCASLELCLLAQGSADVVSYMGPGNYVRNVDIGAGYIILIEAGGQILDGDGKPLNMGLDVRERKNFIAVRSREELEEFL